MGIKTVAILGAYIYLCLPAIRAFLFTCSEKKETRTIACEFSTTNTVQWYYKQKLINTCDDKSCYTWSSNGRYFRYTGIAHKIIISNYTLDDCEMYGCKDVVSSECVTFPHCLVPITSINMTTPTSDKPIEIVEGTMVEFQCRTSSGYPAATVSWYKDATPGVPGGVQRIRDNITSVSVKTGVNILEVTTSTLYMYPSRVDSGSSIYCSANNTAVYILSQRRPMIKLMFPITSINMIKPTSDKLIVVEGTMAEFQCRTSSGYPTATVSWYKDATPGVPGGVLRITDNITSVSAKTGVNIEEFTSSTLYLYPTRIDSGYSIYCSANNTAVHIISQRRPTIKVLCVPSAPIGLSYNVSNNESVLLWKPQFDGGLPQTFVVQLRKQSTDYWIERSIKHERETHLSLRLSFLDDGTNYTAMMYSFNDIGNSSLTQGISFITKVPITSIFMTKPVSDKPIEIVEGTMAEFQCRTSSGYPAAAVSWYKDATPGVPGDVLPIRDNITSYSVKPGINLEEVTTSTLYLYPSRIDSGCSIYCSANNTAVHIISQRRPIIKVLFPITFINMTTPTSDKPIEIIEGTMAEFQCRTSNGYPAATVSWYKDATPGVPGGVQRIRDHITTDSVETGVELVKVTNSILHLYPSRADSGHMIYCSANNSAVHLISQRRPLIKVLCVPSAPIGLSYIVSNNEALLQWKPGFDGGLQQTFVVQLRKQSTDYLMERSIKHKRETHLSLSLSFLDDGTNYTAMIYASNDIGNSALTQGILFQTRGTPTSDTVSSSEHSFARYIGGIVGGSILVINCVACYVFFVVRKRVCSNHENENKLNDQQRSETLPSVNDEHTFGDQSGMADQTRQNRRETHVYEELETVREHSDCLMMHAEKDHELNDQQLSERPPSVNDEHAFGDQSGLADQTQPNSGEPSEYEGLGSARENPDYLILHGEQGNEEGIPLMTVESYENMKLN